MQSSNWYKLLLVILLSDISFVSVIYLRYKTNIFGNLLDSSLRNSYTPDRKESELLLYRTNTTVQQLVQQLHSSGEMLQLVRKVSPNTKSLPQSYPNLNMGFYSFSTLNGTPLPTLQVAARLLKQHRTQQQPITNVMHSYTFSFGNNHYELSFKGYISLLSSLWLSGADLLIVWCNRQPAGRYWKLFVQNVTQSKVQHRVLLGNRPVAHSVFGVKISHNENKIDVMKLETQILFGGIFVDIDVVTVRSLQPLRRHSFVMGEEEPYFLCAGVIMAAPASPFSIMWYMMYQGYFASQWGEFAVILPGHLWKARPNLCHVEKNTIHHPNPTPKEHYLMYEDLSKLKGKAWKWRRNYMLHFWTQASNAFPRGKLSLETVRSANTLYGEVARHVLYGRSELMRS